MHQNTGRLLAGFMLIATFCGGYALSTRGISTSLMSDPDIFSIIATSSLSMTRSILFDLLSNAIGLSLALWLWAYFKNINHRLANAYVVLWAIQLTLIAASNVPPFQLVALAREVNALTAVNMDVFVMMAKQQAEAYWILHFFTLMIHALASFTLYSILFQGKLVPRFLCVWGVLASAVVFVVTVLQVFNAEISMLFYYQNGIFILLLILWLLIRGFSTENYESLAI
jgi:hypothetical protein